MNYLSLDALRAVALPDVVRVEALAHFLNMAPEAVLRELQEGRMPGRQIAGDWLVSRKALFEWLDSRSGVRGVQS